MLFLAKSLKQERSEEGVWGTGAERTLWDRSRARPVGETARRKIGNCKERRMRRDYARSPGRNSEAERLETERSACATIPFPGLKSPNVSRCEAKRRRSERSRRRQLRPRQRCLKLPVPCFDDHIATPAGAMAPAGGLICAKCRFAEFTFVSVVSGVGEETQNYWPSCCCAASKRLARNRFRRPDAGATAGSCFCR